jgi:hypothetical protein
MMIIGRLGMRIDGAYRLQADDGRAYVRVGGVGVVLARLARPFALMPDGEVRLARDDDAGWLAYPVESGAPEPPSMGRVRRLDGGMRIESAPGGYLWAGRAGWHSGGALDLTPNRPATSGHHAWCVVGVDPASDALIAATGTSQSAALPLLPAQIAAVSFNWGAHVALCAVRLRHGMTALSDDDLTRLDNLAWGDAVSLTGTQTLHSKTLVLTDGVGEIRSSLYSAVRIRPLTTGWEIYGGSTGTRKYQINGAGHAFTGRVLFDPGSASEPGFALSNDLDTGIYRENDATLSFSGNGVKFGQIGRFGSWLDVWDSSATNTIVTVFGLRHTTSGTPAAGFGARLAFELESSTGTVRDAAALEAAWVVATDASRRSALRLRAYHGSTAQTGVEIEGDSSVKLGFYGAAPVVKPAISGWSSLTADQKADALKDALVALGLIAVT